MPCRRQSVTAHATVVFFLIGGLSVGSQAYNDITRTDVRIIDDIAPFHTAGNRTVNNDGAHQVPDVSRFASGGVYTDTHFTQFGKQLIRAIDNG